MDENLYDELLFTFTDVLYNLSDISHVVDILEFRRSWQQFFWDFLEDLKGSQDNRLWVTAFRRQKGVEDLEGSWGRGDWEH